MAPPLVGVSITQQPPLQLALAAETRQSEVQTSPARRTAPRPAVAECRFALAPAISMIAEEGFVGIAGESQQAENFTYVKTFRLTRIPLTFSEMAEIRGFSGAGTRESREILGF
jgi:hypothetical protein